MAALMAPGSGCCCCCFPEAAPMPRRPFWCQAATGIVMPCSCAPRPPPFQPAFASSCMPAHATSQSVVLKHAVAEEPIKQMS